MYLIFAGLKSIFYKCIDYFVYQISVHNGQKLLPKSCLLACQIKDLTNNVELIRTMNRLGHGISYDTMQSLLTEVAYQKVGSTDGENVQLPEYTLKELFAMLVEDNIDRLEETLSGKRIIVKNMRFMLYSLFEYTMK